MDMTPSPTPGVPKLLAELDRLAELHEADYRYRTPFNTALRNAYPALRAALLAPQREEARAGMVLVPREPTEAMIEAAEDTDSADRHDTHPYYVPATVYRAMIAAAPSAQEGP